MHLSWLKQPTCLINGGDHYRMEDVTVPRKDHSGVNFTVGLVFLSLSIPICKGRYK